MDTENIIIEATPKLISSYAKAIIKGQRYKEGDQLPKLKYTWDDFRFPRKKISAYRQVCKLGPGIEAPLFFPHSFFGGIHLMLMTHPSFPLRPMGTIHCRNHVIQYLPLKTSDSYSAVLELTEQRRRPQGLEFDLSTRVFLGTKVVWESISTYLVRMNMKGEDPASHLADLVSNLDEKIDLTTFKVPSVIGREFGRITGDINPIHMSRTLAKAFGFKRDLAHGMWTVGRGLPLFQHIDYKKPIRHDVLFKGPTYIGELVTVKGDPTKEGAFEYYSGTNDRPSVVGFVRNVNHDEML